jgi:ubiquitin C-terminal hydrolase
MWSGNGIVSPIRFINYIQKTAKKMNREIFSGFAQNDMTEFLMFFLECIHENIYRNATISIKGEAQNGMDRMAIECYKELQRIYTTEYSEILDLFYGIYVSELISIDGFTSHSIKPQLYFIWELPIIHRTTTTDNFIQCSNIYQCIDLYHSPEFLLEENAWFNEKSGRKENVKKQISFWNFPKILVITLQRFSPDGQHKMNHLVEFPIDNLDLSKYVRGYNPSSYVYDLYGVCNHIGGVSGGHYTAFIRNLNNQWIHFNDENIEIIENPQHIIQSNAYCLFYRKKNNFI